MAAIFQCFRRKRSENSQSHNECEHEKPEKIMLCPNCKSTMMEYVPKDGTDGRPCSKFLKSGRNGETVSADSTLSSQSSNDGNSPTSQIPPPLYNNGFLNDYRPSAQDNISGMSYMPVSKTDPNYNMNHTRRGKAVIFNFDRWDNTGIPSLDQNPRIGSKKDKKDLADCFQKLSFEVIEHDNLKRQKFDKVIERLRKEDHSDADCLVVVIMTHGEKNTFYLSDGTQIPVNLVWEQFEANKCPTLAAKPKIFIIQACRGDRYDHGTVLTGAGQVPLPQNDVTDSGTFSYVIPNAADIIVAFSCPLGHYSWRSPEKGSWFIQSICKVFNQHAYDMDLKSLLTTVSREVAVNYESVTSNIDSDRKKQVPSTSSTLIRNVVFTPKPLVLQTQPHRAIGNGAIVDITPGKAEANGNGHLISLHEVQLAVAEATEQLNESQAKIPEIMPMPALPALASQNGTVSLVVDTTEVPDLTQSEDSDSNDDEPERPEDSLITASLDAKNLPCQ